MPPNKTASTRKEDLMQIQESGEMYLETILRLSKDKSSVRAIDISEQMGYSKPSVSRALGLLKQGEYITVDACGHISLTEAGREIAEKIYERHTLLSDFLVTLGVDKETAMEDACRLEHAISDTSFEALKAFVSSMRK
jgi:Mn-dependent DtxR family transcriptional regulator